MARPKKMKEAVHNLPDVEVAPEDKTAAENNGQLNRTSDRPANNFELYVQQIINEIKQAEMAEKFEKSVKLHGTKKVTIRVDREVYDFYQNLPLDCTTAMKKALRIVMDAAKAQSIKF